MKKIVQSVNKVLLRDGLQIGALLIMPAMAFFVVSFVGYRADLIRSSAMHDALAIVCMCAAYYAQQKGFYGEVLKERRAIILGVSGASCTRYLGYRMLEKIYKFSGDVIVAYHLWYFWKLYL